MGSGVVKGLFVSIAMALLVGRTTAQRIDRPDRADDRQQQEIAFRKPPRTKLNRWSSATSQMLRSYRLAEIGKVSAPPSLLPKIRTGWAGIRYGIPEWPELKKSQKDRKSPGAPVFIGFQAQKKTPVGVFFLFGGAGGI